MSQKRTSSSVCEDIERNKRATTLFRNGKKEEAMALVYEGREENPDNEFFCVTAGVMEGKMGNDDKARELFTEALKIQPDCVPSLQAWGVMEMERGRQDKAEQLFKKALSIFPEHIPTLQAYARLHIRRRNDAAGRKLLQRALQVNPEHLPAIHILVELEMRLNNSKRVLELLKAMLDIDPGNVPAITSLGKFYWYRGDKEKARSVFESVEKHRSDETIASVLCCWSNLERQAGNVELAREKFILALKHDPRHVSSLISLAALEARAGRPKEAHQYYERVLEVDKYRPYVCNSVVHFLCQLGKKEEAKKLLQDLLEKRPSVNVSWHMLGQIYMEEGKLQEARHCFESGMKIDRAKGALRCIEGLAELEAFLGNIDKARELYISGEKRFTPRSRYYRMWANFEKRQANYDAARKLFKKAYDQQPQDTKTLLQWGQLEIRSGNEDKAESCFLEGLKSTPKNSFLWYSYARMLMLRGDIAKAREVLKNALANCPRNSPLIMEYGIMEWNQGNVEAARKLFQSGMNLENAPIHLPLVEAWLQMESGLGNKEAVARLEGQLHALRAIRTASSQLPDKDDKALKLLEKF